MKKIMLIAFFLISLSLIFIHCNKSNSSSNTIACTMEFRTISIKVLGDTLNHFYTIRANTGDTIIVNSGTALDSETYPVLDDTYLNRFINSTEQFRFVGLKNNIVLVNELFTINADQCHINYVSGNQTVIL